MTTYNVEIVVNGKGNAGSFLQSTGGALSNIGQIAGGILTAGVFQNIGNAIMGAGQEALASYASYERLGSSLQSLTAKELLNTGAAKNMTEAMGMAKGTSQELLGWIQKLAIQSPFKQEDVANSFRLAQAYGFTVEEAKRLTQATIDFASGSGASSYAMEKIALALGQIKAKGKLAGGEMLQLTEAGLDVRNILAKAFNVTTAELVEMQEKGLIPADKAIEAIVKSLETDFGGAAKNQAATFSGLISSLEDIKSVGLREFFTGTFQAIQPYVSKFVDTLSSPQFMTSLREMGMRLGDFVSKALENIPKLLRPFELFFNMVERGVNPLNALGRTFSALMSGIGSGGGILSAIGNAFAGIGGIVSGALGAGVFGQMIFSVLSSGFSLAIPKIGPLFAGLLKNMLSAGFLTNGGIVGTLVEVLFVTPFGKLSGILAPIFSKLAPIAGVIAKVFGPLAGIMGGIAPVMLIAVAALTALGIGIKAMQGDTGFFAGLWERLQGAFDKFGAAFSRIMPVLQGVGGKIFDAISRGAQTLAEQVLPFLVGQIDKLAIWFNQNTPLINNFITALGNFFTNVLVPAVVGAWSVISPILSGLLDVIMGLATFVMQVLTGDWAGAWASIKQVVADAANAIWLALQNLWTWIVDLFTSLYETLVGQSIIPDMMAAIVAAFVGMKDSVVAFVTELWQNIVTTFTNLAADLQSKWNEITMTARSKWTEIKTAITTIIMELVTWAFNKFQELKTSIMNIWNEIVTITQNAWTEFKNAILTPVSEAISEILSRFSQLATDIATELADVASALVDAVSGWVSAMVTAASGFAEVGAAIVGYIYDSIVGNISKVIDFLTGIIAKIIGDLLASIGLGGPETPPATPEMKPALSRAGLSALSRTGGGGGSQVVTINIYGATDAKSVAREVAAQLKLQGVNMSLLGAR